MPKMQRTEKTPHFPTNHLAKKPRDYRGGQQQSAIWLNQKRMSCGSTVENNAPLPKPPPVADNNKPVP